MYFINFNNLFFTKSITEDRIYDFVADTKTKRICFSRVQTHALWRTEDGKDMLTVPFSDSIGLLLKEQTGIVLRKSLNERYYQTLDKDGYEKVKAFIDSYSDVVFLRDLLDVSVALSLNFEDDGETHTRLGLLEKQAKYDSNDNAVDQLAVIVDDFIGRTPLYANTDLICAVPASKVGEESLPVKIVKKLTTFTGRDISGGVKWTYKSASLKNADCVDKLEILRNSGFEISEGLDIKGKNIVLVDDLYMSGVTLQYVAMKLKEAGVSKVYGLCVVKSLGNK